MAEKCTKKATITVAVSGLLLAAGSAAAPGAMAQSAEPAKPSAVLPQITVEGTHKKPAPRKAVRASAPAPVTVTTTAPRPVSPPSTEAAAAVINPSRQVQGFVAQSANTGTKTNTPLREVPQSISVVTREQMDDRGATTLIDAIDYSAGITVNPWGLDTRSDNFMLRGFLQNFTGLYRDGLNLPTFSFSFFRIEPYGVDHVDILKGPTAMLYGLNNPGGLVNVVSKMPSDKPFGEIWTSYGSFNSWQTGIDMGGPLDPSGKVTYRVTALVRDADTQVDYVENDRVFVAPALTFHPDSATTFTLLTTYQRDKTGDTYQFLPAEGTLYPSSFGHLSRNTFMGEPDWSKFIGEQWSVGYQFEHKIDPALTFRQNFRYDHETTFYNTIYGAGPLEGNVSAILREAEHADETLDVFQIDNNFQYEAQLGQFHNKILFGVDARHFVADSKIGIAGVGNSAVPITSETLLSPEAYFNPFHPVYGQYYFFDLNDFSRVSQPPLAMSVTQEQNQVGAYLQDQIKFDRHWLLTLSGREDFVTTDTHDHMGNPSYSAYDEAFSGRAGLGYLFDNGLTPYVSYASSFYPTGYGLVHNGTMLQPETAQQLEGGVKYQPNGSKSYFTAAIYDLTKQNVTESDPSFPGFYIQVGEVEVKGVELEGVADLGNGWKILGSFTHMNTEITKDTDPTLIGNRLSRTPNDTASGWVDYTFREGFLAGLGTGVGVRYMGDTFGDDANTIKVPNYTLVDASLRYQYDNWKVTLSVTNLFDKEYVGTCGDANMGVSPPFTDFIYCSYGQARTAMLQVSRKW